MNKIFRVNFEDKDGNDFYSEVPTYEEASTRAAELYDEGYDVTSIEEIRV